MTVEWDGDKLIVRHKNGGGVDLTNFSSTGLGTATFDVADTAVSALKEPVTFQDTAASTVGSAKGVMARAKLPLIFLILLDMLQMVPEQQILPWLLNMVSKLLMVTDTTI